MKKNSMGFIMAEAIIVSSIVVTALILIYTQFISINNSYNKSFKYNTVNNLYATNEFLKFLRSDNLDNIINDMQNNTYIDISLCSTAYINESDYCKYLIEALNIKTLIISRENLTMLKQELDNYNVFSESMHSFIKNINYKDEGGYRLIVEFNDDTFATLKINGYISLVKNISNICIKQDNCTSNDIAAGITMDIAVNDDEAYNFTILNKTDSYVDLIMSSDLDNNLYNNSKLYFTSETEIKMPDLYQIIENKTKNWTNIPLEYYDIPMYLYKNNTLTKYTSHKYLRARLPHESDFILSGNSVSNNLQGSFYIDDVIYNGGLITKAYNNNKLINTTSSKIRPVIRLDIATIKAGELSE